MYNISGAYAGLIHISVIARAGISVATICNVVYNILHVSFWFCFMEDKKLKNNYAIRCFSRRNSKLRFVQIQLDLPLDPLDQGFSSRRETSFNWGHLEGVVLLARYYSAAFLSLNIANGKIILCLFSLRVRNNVLFRFAEYRKPRCNLSKFKSLDVIFKFSFVCGGENPINPLILYFLLVYAQPWKEEWNVKNCCLSRSDCQRKITWNQVCTCVLARHKHWWFFFGKTFFAPALHDCNFVMKSRESSYFRWK